MSNIINCKAIRDKYIEEIKQKDLTGCTVAFIQVGDNPASNTYVRNKKKLCEEVGIEVEHYHLSENTTEEQLLATIDMLNRCSVITGILVQLPLPSHIDENKVINAIDPNKDIDGFSDYHKGKLLNGDKDAILPCTPKGIMTILKEEGIDLKGKNVVVVGRSNIVGKPLTAAMINDSATVTCCNSKTDREFLTDLIFSSDIFISAIGKANYFNEKFFLDNRMLPEYLEDTIAIDVGINKDENNKLCGDIDKELYPYFKKVTSVPGGVGVMTTLTVVSNIVELFERNK
ncbi:bifunctional 5,10-methylenetetrahydrofolate dehydrogenase/5,10-methenyltetrahydrofolate cyclohydrolase [Paraclostridium bifermentans]|uniref:bifunctional 5,10-methylenetetrahydrofolate dehydrogenase/5,10-methenyltetrahydrofolate cyclohydrolase n=1 Tax=Paraclostridium bifermentans TaxID=1490 RepID=UPI00189ED16D|nr:bifunctional 5,10-methylenetetrahydrofolate dehydrogenase/5,10-methenyltetrahydrofolate cyclohydrolase [Paraclostridium bifermentans]